MKATDPHTTGTPLHTTSERATTRVLQSGLYKLTCPDRLTRESAGPRNYNQLSIWGPLVRPSGERNPIQRRISLYNIKEIKDKVINPKCS